MTYDILSVGHSTLSYDRFLSLLRDASVNAIADVRSAPYSRHFPHFSRTALRDKLRDDNIAYVFLGDVLGGRPDDGRLFRNGIADYEKMAQTDNFAKGLKRLVDGARKYRLAMMCSEHDPLDCHRCLLVGRALHERGTTVGHILASGIVIDQNEIEMTLLGIAGKRDADFFDPPETRLATAYRDRAAKVAYAEPKIDTDWTVAAE